MGLCVLLGACSTTRYSPLDDRVAAKEGNSNAKLGERYLLGRGVQQNNQRALHYFSLAANNDNDAFAQNELGYMYAAGKGAPRNYQLSLLYYQKAAEQGLAGAQYNLGLMYLHGLGTEPDKEMARKWIKKSAASGFEPATIALKKLRA